MNVSVWVVVLLVLLSGGIAAFGDWLGRRLGKKRLRFGRLRPKHTAIVGTAIAGMLTTLVTILLLSLVSEQVRVWLVQGTSVQKRLKETSGNLDRATAQLQQRQKDLTDVRGQLQDEQAKLAEEQAKVAAATKEATAMRQEAALLRGQVSSLRGELKTSRKSLDELNKQYEILKRESTRLLGDIKTYSDEQRRLYDKNNELLKQNDELGQEVDRLQASITSLNKQVSDAQSAQKLATENFNNELGRIQQSRTSALADLVKAQGELDIARRELRDLQTQANYVLDDNIRARMSPLIYNRGGELTRLAVRSRLSQAEARTFLLAAIEAASRDALARGAVEAPSSRAAAAFWSYSTGNGQMVTAEMQFQLAIDAIAAKDPEQVIVVRAFRNAFKGEFVRIAVEALPNPVVYHAGDFIIETKVDGKLGVQGVTEALVNFMAVQLRERAVHDGMVPAIGRQTELGAITQEQLQQIVQAIVDTQRTITVRFHAKSDTKAADLLTLDVRLR